MNSKSLRRLAADHSSLHTAGLPPNYLFPSSQAAELPSDLTSLDLLLAGPVGTPYAHGVWRLHLDIPPTYPNAPPTATFRTRLWHPNIDEATGAVCVETLKRDWSSSLKLRDVLITISCLLIQPNPASALNEAAGKLASEDWDGYCRRAKLMTEIHAAIPSNITEEVREAQSRGEEKDIKTQTDPAEANLNAKEKGVAKATFVTPKLRTPGAVEDEENSRQRNRASEDSDPESDWIPGPTTLKASEVPRIGRSNVFGIQGLGNSMKLHLPEQSNITQGLRRNYISDKEDEIDASDISDPFITIPSKRPAKQISALQAPSDMKPTSTYTPELLKFSDKNPFSAIQPNNQYDPLVREFSWSWADNEIMNNPETEIKNGETRADVRKRLASDDFEKKRVWELKRFKETGYDLKKYNRGDFGPRTGLKRL